MFFCLLVPVVSTFSYLHYHKKQVRRQIKHEMMDNLDKESFVHLKFSKKDAEDLLKWKHSKEFEYDGEMYDVVQVIESEDSLQYYCWWDHKETALNRTLNKTLYATMNKDNENKKHQNNWISWLKNIVPSENLCLNPIEFKGHLKWRFYSESLTDLSLIPLTPPPKA